MGLAYRITRSLYLQAGPRRPGRTIEYDPKLTAEDMASLCHDAADHLSVMYSRDHGVFDGHNAIGQCILHLARRLENESEVVRETWGAHRNQ